MKLKHACASFVSALSTGQFTRRTKWVLLLPGTQIRHNNIVVFFVLLTVTFSSTIKSERIVVFPLQQRLREFAAVLILRFVACRVYFKTYLLFKDYHQT